jgi:hypothetical protein
MSVVPILVVVWVPPLVSPAGSQDRTDWPIAPADDRHSIRLTLRTEARHFTLSSTQRKPKAQVIQGARAGKRGASPWSRRALAIKITGGIADRDDVRFSHFV